MFGNYAATPPYLSLKRPISSRFVEFRETVSRLGLETFFEGAIRQLFGVCDTENLSDAEKELVLERCRLCLASAIVGLALHGPCRAPVHAPFDMPPPSHLNAAQSELYRIWQKTGGRPDKALHPLMKQIAIFDDKAEDGDSPALFYCGEDSVIARWMGLEWANSPNLSRPALPPSVRRKIAAGLHDAIRTDHPVHDTVQISVQTLEGEHGMTINRLILPFWSSAGVRHLYSLSSS
ncbi:hypothetical protein GR183_19430 [Stappia sp. GBMRC 2046]|uniref:Uncharacterized protein n=1 Tax=Stappia sediminis TaxID=2692190 RepID=A0A7X3LXW0_9HYPH|nr:hypothetical protein [Stappia sediminis]MXN67088.1 hypothetical protein [Stappia sediminis]